MKPSSRGNPQRSPEDLRQAFGALLLEGTAESLEIAQDLLLENETSLADVSMDKHLEDDLSGRFVLPNGVEVAWFVSGHRYRARPAAGQRYYRADMAIRYHGAWWYMSDDREIEPPGVFVGHFHNAGDTADLAALYAWAVVWALVTDDRDDSRDNLAAILTEAWAKPNLRELRKRTRRSNPELVDNPQWVTGLLTRAWSEIDGKVSPSLMPKLDRMRTAGRTSVVARLKEYGCGAYGCVLPTNDPGVVIKVTTDTTEAEFAAQLASTLVKPICATYDVVIRLEGETHEGRPVFLLWREAASEVGGLETHPDIELIDAQHQKAQAVYDEIMLRVTAHIKHGGARGVFPGHQRVRLEVLLHEWETACHEMAAIPELEDVANGLIAVYRQQDIFFGDLHAGNFGKVTRNGKEMWVITDPGHVAVVT